MTAPSETKEKKLIHAGKIFDNSGFWRYLLLRKIDDVRYAWFEESPSGEELLTSIEAINPEEAIRLAIRQWKHVFYQNLNCGFRYTLPERDEHGINAYFHQMAASYASMNGIYYDEELGNNCYVQNASDEALKLWRRLSNRKS